MDKYKKDYISKTPNKIKMIGDSVTIYLNKKDGSISGETIVDLDTYELIKNYRIFHSSDGYAIISGGKYAKQRLHRFVLNELGTNNIIDHINRNKLDNRRSNLRICQTRFNASNCNISKNNTSGFTGVWYDNTHHKWKSEIKVKRKKICLGTFVNKEDAIVARLNAEVKYFGEFAPQRHLFEQYKIKNPLNAKDKNEG